MTIWMILDLASEQVIAAYSSEALAHEHVLRADGYVQQIDILDELSVDVQSVDPVIELQRRQQEHATVLAERRTQEERAQINEDFLQRYTISDASHPTLCHCQLFSKHQWFITTHGYCQFCGGWIVEVFRRQLGEVALQHEIDRLAEHDRNDMRAIVNNVAGAR